MEMYCIILLLFLCPGNEAWNSVRHARTELVDQLTKNHSGEDFVPASAVNGTLYIDVIVNIYSVFGLNQDEILEMNGWVEVNWKDSLFSWKPEEWSNVTSVILPGDKFWKPDIGISNSKQIESKDFTQKENLRIRMSSEGDATYMGYFLSETPCPINTKMFPFDKQICPLLIGSFISPRSEFTIRVKSVYASVENNYMTDWRLMNFSKSEEEVIKDDHKNPHRQFQMVKINFYLTRKPMFHVVLIIVPYCLISIVGAIMFVIRGSEERYSISLSILLAMSIYVMISAHSSPKSMDSLSILDFFLLVQMCLLVLLTFVIVLGPIMCKKQMKKRRILDAEEGEEPDDTSAISHHGSVVRIIHKRFDGWNFVCDLICLAIYLTGSVINIITCSAAWRTSRH